MSFTRKSITCSPDKDPLLANRMPANRRLPLAGSAYHELQLWARVGNKAKCEEIWGQFIKDWLEP